MTLRALLLRRKPKPITPPPEVVCMSIEDIARAKAIREMYGGSHIPCRGETRSMDDAYGTVIHG